MNKNFKMLFLNPDEKSDKWETEFFKAGYKSDLKKIKEMINETNEMYMEEARICTAMKDFIGNEKTILEKENIIKDLKNIDFVLETKVIKNSVLIRTDKGIIKFCKLSDVIEELKQDPDIETENRLDNCHEKAVEISRRLREDNEVVTGYIYGISDKAKYLHSWVEVSLKDGQKFVLDYTKNIMINKEGYYFITHAEPLSRIKSKDMKEDDKIIDKLAQKGIYFNIKEYLVFRDEIMADLKKNEQLFVDDER